MNSKRFVFLLIVTDLGCVECHMPLIERPLVEDGQVRPARRHLWRDGHRGSDRLLSGR